MDFNSYIINQFKDNNFIKEQTLSLCKNEIIAAIEILCTCFRSGNKLLLCGNGGSAADCQHVAAEFMIRLNHNINRPALPAIALTTDTSNLTAGGNDIGFENVFARNVQGLGNPNDVLIAISTSGNSQNVILAIEQAKAKNMKVLALLGCDGGKIKSLADVSIVVPSKNTQRIQETHLLIEHILCESTEIELYQNEN